jgi:uncharacterized protein (TIGR03435 family)
MRFSIAIVLTFISSSYAQTSAPAVTFDAAAIHVTEPGLPTAEFHTRPGMLLVHNNTLRSCIEWAYGLRPLQIEGPAWLNDLRIDINARAADPGADDEQLRVMLRALLADRFGMKAHRERKEQPIYSLTVAKGGPKFHSTGTKDASRFVQSTTEGPSNFSEDKTGALADRVDMNEVADKVSQLLNRIVVDNTGLTGRYDFRLDLFPYMTPDTDGKDGPKADIMGVLFAGFNDQPGLKLEAGKEAVDLLLIDSVNKTPTAN